MCRTYARTCAGRTLADGASFIEVRIIHCTRSTLSMCRNSNGFQAVMKIHSQTS